MVMFSNAADTWSSRRVMVDRCDSRHSSNGGHYNPHCRIYSFFMRGVDLSVPHIGESHHVRTGFSKLQALSIVQRFGPMDHESGDLHEV